ncbi:MAG: hypothetical protein ACTSWU_02180 [Candidatus Thorarchaeota archaeon]
MTEMKRKANGKATVAFVKLTSVIIMIATKPPKIKNDRIIRAVMMFLIRVTSISGSS